MCKEEDFGTERRDDLGIRLRSKRSIIPAESYPLTFPTAIAQLQYIPIVM